MIHKNEAQLIWEAYTGDKPKDWSKAPRYPQGHELAGHIDWAAIYAAQRAKDEKTERNLVNRLVTGKKIRYEIFDPNTKRYYKIPKNNPPGYFVKWIDKEKLQALIEIEGAKQPIEMWYDFGDRAFVDSYAV